MPATFMFAIFFGVVAVVAALITAASKTPPGKEMPDARASGAIRTAQSQATANDDLAASLSKNPDVLIAQCLNMETAAQKAGYTYQPGFGCGLFSGSSSVGVIAGGK